MQTGMRNHLENPQPFSWSSLTPESHSKGNLDGLWPLQKIKQYMIIPISVNKENVK